jgi:DNA repair protein RecO (recombination protein O)
MSTGPGIIRTDAVVLRTLDYGETSRIATLFTHEVGKLSVMARGARAAKSRFGSMLEPLAYIQAIIYIKPSRDLQSLTDASHVRTFSVVRESLSGIRAGLGFLELTNAFMQEGEPNADAFSLLVNALTHLNERETPHLQLSLFFKLRLASLLGYSPSFNKTQVEALGESGGVLDLNSGAMLLLENEETQARHPSGISSAGAAVHDPASTVAASRSALRAFAITARAPLSTVLCMNLRPETARELDDLISSYVRFHFAESYPTRASSIFAKMGTG